MSRSRPNAHHSASSSESTRYPPPSRRANIHPPRNNRSSNNLDDTSFDFMGDMGNTLASMGEPSRSGRAAAAGLRGQNQTAPRLKVAQMRTEKAGRKDQRRLKRRGARYSSDNPLDQAKQHQALGIGKPNPFGENNFQSQRTDLRSRNNNKRNDNFLQPGEGVVRQQSKRDRRNGANRNNAGGSSSSHGRTNGANNHYNLEDDDEVEVVPGPDEFKKKAQPQQQMKTMTDNIPRKKLPSNHSTSNDRKASDNHKTTRARQEQQGVRSASKNQKPSSGRQRTLHEASKPRSQHQQQSNETSKPRAKRQQHLHFNDSPSEPDEVIDICAEDDDDDDDDDDKAVTPAAPVAEKRRQQNDAKPAASSHPAASGATSSAATSSAASPGRKRLSEVAGSPGRSSVGAYVEEIDNRSDGDDKELSKQRKKQKKQAAPPVPDLSDSKSSEQASGDRARSKPKNRSVGFDGHVPRDYKGSPTHDDEGFGVEGTLHNLRARHDKPKSGKKRAHQEAAASKTSADDDDEVQVVEPTVSTTTTRTTRQEKQDTAQDFVKSFEEDGAFVPPASSSSFSLNRKVNGRKESPPAEAAATGCSESAFVHVATGVGRAARAVGSVAGAAAGVLMSATGGALGRNPKKPSPRSQLSSVVLESFDKRDAAVKKKNNRKRATPITAGASIQDRDRAFGNQPKRRRTRSSIRAIMDSDDDYQPEAQSNVASTDRRMTRRQSRLRKNDNDVIELSDDDDETPATSVRWYDVARIALGSKIFRHECKIAWNDSGEMELSAKSNNGNDVKEHTIRSEEVKMGRYFAGCDDAAADDSDSVDDREPIYFVALRVEKTEVNGLIRYSNQYKPDGEDDKKKYILVDFRSDSDCKEFVEARPPTMKAFFDEKSSLKPSQVNQYCERLDADTKKEAAKARRSPGSTKRAGFLAGKQEDDVLLIYPFGADKNEIEKTADGLLELSGPLYGKQEEEAPEIPPAASASSMDNGTSEEGAEAEKDEAADQKKKNRMHYLTVRVGDYDRLQPGEFLNDTLIDFFLQWMMRHDDRSSIHVFSSHFYTTLLEEGVDSVTKWTKKKGIDVFSRKFIFIPINKTLHWSMCVIINPSNVMEQVDRVAAKNKLKKKKKSDGDVDAMQEEIKEFDQDDPMTCMLFMDSLRAHQKKQVQKKIVAWLNSEWKRLGKGKDGEPEDPEDPFKISTLPIVAPRVPYQDNTWDCGVFACRYAYSIYLLRDKPFSFRELDCKEGLAKLITDSKEFDFGMDDIARIRDEMKKWIENLHRIYAAWKRDEDKKEQEAKAAARRARLEAAGEPAQSQNSLQSEGSSTVHVVEQAPVASTDSRKEDDSGEEALVQQTAQLHLTPPEEAGGRKDGANADALADNEVKAPLSDFFPESDRNASVSADAELPITTGPGPSPAKSNDTGPSTNVSSESSSSSSGSSGSSDSSGSSGAGRASPGDKTPEREVHGSPAADPSAPWPDNQSVSPRQLYASPKKKEHACDLSEDYPGNSDKGGFEEHSPTTSTDAGGTQDSRTSPADRHRDGGGSDQVPPESPVTDEI